jgi:hypothetical protein
MDLNPNWSKWVQMALKWAQIDLNGPEWTQINQNEPKGSKWTMFVFTGYLGSCGGIVGEMLPFHTLLLEFFSSNHWNAEYALSEDMQPIIESERVIWLPLCSSLLSTIVSSQ